jgi:hypothetical protein
MFTDATASQDLRFCAAQNSSSSAATSPFINVYVPLFSISNHPAQLSQRNILGISLQLTFMSWPAYTSVTDSFFNDTDAQRGHAYLLARSRLICRDCQVINAAMPMPTDTAMAGENQ